MKKNNYHQKLRMKKVKVFGKSISSSLILICFFVVGFYGFRCGVEKMCGVNTITSLVRSSVTITMPSGAITAEVADTRSSRELGLSGRKSIPSNKGLLFIFDAPGRYGFWMKDMLFPLDIIWINEDGVVVEVERNVATSTYPSKTFINASPATYVLELNAGEAEKGRVYIGSKVKIID